MQRPDPGLRTAAAVRGALVRSAPSKDTGVHLGAGWAPDPCVPGRPDPGLERLVALPRNARFGPSPRNASGSSLDRATQAVRTLTRRATTQSAGRRSSWSGARRAACASPGSSACCCCRRDQVMVGWVPVGSGFAAANLRDVPARRCAGSCATSLPRPAPSTARAGCPRRSGTRGQPCSVSCQVPSARWTLPTMAGGDALQRRAAVPQHGWPLLGARPVARRLRGRHALVLVEAIENPAGPVGDDPSRGPWSAWWSGRISASSPSRPSHFRRPSNPRRTPAAGRRKNCRRRAGLRVLAVRVRGARVGNTRRSSAGTARKVTATARFASVASSFLPGVGPLVPSAGSTDCAPKRFGRASLANAYGVTLMSGACFPSSATRLDDDGLDLRRSIDVEACSTSGFGCSGQAEARGRYRPGRR